MAGQVSSIFSEMLLPVHTWSAHKRPCMRRIQKQENDHIRLQNGFFCQMEWSRWTKHAEMSTERKYYTKSKLILYLVIWFHTPKCIKIPRNAKTLAPFKLISCSSSTSITSKGYPINVEYDRTWKNKIKKKISLSYPIG